MPVIPCQFFPGKLTNILAPCGFGRTRFAFAKTLVNRKSVQWIIRKAQASR